MMESFKPELPVFKIFWSVSAIIWIVALNGPIYSSVTTTQGYLSVKRLRVRFQLFSITSISTVTVLLDSEYWVCNTSYSIVNWLITDLVSCNFKVFFVNYVSIQIQFLERGQFK
jgi:hypothetical protein